MFEKHDLFLIMKQVKYSCINISFTNTYFVQLSVNKFFLGSTYD